jgi:hypothetical protein
MKTLRQDLAIKTLDFSAIVRRFGPVAANELSQKEKSDAEAISAVADPNMPTRHEVVLEWLRDYSAFRGIKGPFRSDIVQAFLRWADDRSRPLELHGEDQICDAHNSLTSACELEPLKGRGLTSLISKALWLRYPETVPIFDGNAQRALQVLCKLDDRLPLLGPKLGEYEAFVRVWSVYYVRNRQGILDAITNGYSYPVRILDVILWKLGSPSYLWK